MILSQQLTGWIQKSSRVLIQNSRSNLKKMSAMAAFVCQCVYVWRLVVLTSASGWAWVAVGLSWKVSGTFVDWNNKQAASREERGVTHGASSNAANLLLTLTRTRWNCPVRPKIPPELRRATFLSTLPQWIIYLRDKSRPVWLYVCVLMWPVDGKNRYSTRLVEKLSHTDAL